MIEFADMNEEMREAMALLVKVVLVMNYLSSLYCLYEYYPIGLIGLTISLGLNVWYLAE